MHSNLISGQSPKAKTSSGSGTEFPKDTVIKESRNLKGKKLRECDGVRKMKSKKRRKGGRL